MIAILAILMLSCSSQPPDTSTIPVKEVAPSVATPPDSSESSQEPELPEDVVASNASLFAILTNPAFYCAPESQMGKYQLVNERGNMIAHGNNWPGAIDLKTGQSFVYESDLPSYHGRKEVFFYFKDGNYHGAQVTIDGRICKVAKVYNPGELIDQWSLGAGDYPADCTVVWFTCDSSQAKPINTLIVKATAPLQMGIPYAGATVFWAYLPSYRDNG